jgi:hypothetical protein
VNDKGHYHSLTGDRKEDGEERRQGAAGIAGVTKAVCAWSGPSTSLYRILHRQYPQPSHSAVCAHSCRVRCWCEREDIPELADIEPMHVAAYVETLGLRLAAPSVKQQLAAIRMLFD